MGFWYFLVLCIGVFLVITAMIKRSKKSTKSMMVLLGACMIAFSLFMFQDDSAEIVDKLLKTLNINL